MACYAKGDATSTSDTAGGLVGQNISGGTISACYSTGDATSTSGTASGLVGDNGGTIEYSYFDSDASNRSSSDANSKTASELISPTGYTDIYVDWNIDVDNGLSIGIDNAQAGGDTGADNVWDFGTNAEYPALKVDFEVDGTPSVAEFGTQLRTPPLRITDISPILGLRGETVTITGSGYSATASENVVTFLGGSSATATSVTVSSTTELEVIVPSAAVTGRISVSVGGVAPNSGSSVVSVQEFTIDRDTDMDGLIDVRNFEQLDAMRYDLDGDGIPAYGQGIAEYNAAFGTSFGVADADNDNAVNNSATITGYELTRNLDFEAGASYAGSRNLAWIDPANGGIPGNTEGWLPIGDISTPFRATFEGNDNTISNLYIDRTSRVGLFGVVDTGGKIKNLGLVGGSVEGYTSVGCLAGRNEGTISACYATGDATSPSGQAGGLVGNNTGAISGSYATGNAMATGLFISAGGLVGQNSGTISACYATGDATSPSGTTGGLVGYNSGEISGSYAEGNVETGSSAAGGLVGTNTFGNTISACYAIGTATSISGSVGGLVGYNNGGGISACYAEGNVETGSSNAGGLVGQNISGGTISACYAKGNATATSGAAGGLVGFNNSSSTISACYLHR